MLISGARPYGDEVQDLLLADGSIAAIGTDAGRHPAAPQARVIDGTGLILLPGLVDLHTHLREPGREDSETVASGSQDRKSVV